MRTCGSGQGGSPRGGSSSKGSKSSPWAAKLKQYLSRIRNQLTSGEYRDLQRKADNGDHGGFKSLLERTLRKGFVCSDHKGVRHGCDQHCDMKHRGFEEILRPGCKFGCKAKNWFEKAWSDVTNWFSNAARDVGKWVEGAARDVGKEMNKFGKGVADFFKNPAEALCQSFLGPICPLVKIVIAFLKKVVEKGDVIKAFGSLFEDFKKRVERFGKKAGQALEALFKSLDDVFGIENERQILPRIERFAGRVVQEIKKITVEFHKFVDMPKFIGEIVGFITGVATAGALIPPVSLIATIGFGARKLMEFLVPKLILGLGDLMGELNKLPGPVKEVAKGIFNFVKTIVPAVGGLMGGLMSKRTKERIQAILRKVADISGKISSGIKGALAVAEQVRTGTFADVQKAFASQATLPAKLTTEDLRKIIGGLADFAGDQIWAKLEGVLGKLLGKLFGLLDPLLDTARATLIGPVGSIPFVGGVLASALNVGAGLLVTMAKDFIIGKILGFAHKQVDFAVNSMKAALEKELLRSKSNVGKTKGFVQLVQLVGNVAGEISSVSKDLANGMSGVTASLGALAATALDKFLLRGIRDEQLRQILSSAIGEVIRQLGEKGRFDLSGAVVSVLRSVASPLAALVARAIPDNKLKGLVQRGLEGLLKGLANASGVQKIMQNPMGFLAGVAKELLVSLKNDLAGLLLGSIHNPQLRDVVGAAVGTLAETVEREGFSGLLRFKELFGRLFRALKGPLLALLVQRISDPQVKAIVERGLTFVLSEVESKGLGEILRGGIIATLARLLETIKDPLVNLVLRDVPSPDVRALALQGLDALIAEAKAGKIDALLNLNQAVQKVEAVKAKAAKMPSAGGGPASAPATSPAPKTTSTTPPQGAGLQPSASAPIPASSGGATVPLPPTPGQGAIQAWSGRWDSVKGAADTIGDAAGKLAGVTGNTLQKHAIAAWRGLKTVATKVSCGRFVDWLAKDSPIVDLLRRLYSPTATCLVEMQKGFLCGIPDLLQEVGQIAMGSAESAWTHKSQCLPYAFMPTPLNPSGLGPMALTNPVGALTPVMVCGFSYWVVEKGTQAWKCIRQLTRDRVINLILQEALSNVCGLVGSLAFDAFVAAISAGVSFPATVVKFLSRLKDALDKVNPSTWLGIVSKVGATAVDTDFGFVKSVLKNLPACQF